MSLLTKNAVPAEIARGCVFAENFRNIADVIKNGGTVAGSPAFVDGGVVLNAATKYVTYPPEGLNAIADSKTISVIFDADFTFISSAYQVLFQIQDASTGIFAVGVNNEASTTAKTLYTNNGALSVSTTTITPGRHKVGITVDASGNTIFYIDGVKLGNTVTNAWTGRARTTLVTFGTSWNNLLTFGGTVYDMKIFNAVLTAQEVLDYATNSTFNYEQKCLVNLPMTMDCHDPTNLKAKDASGKGNHATFGDGATSTTYPTKLPARGYSFDGGDYFNLGDLTAMNSATAFTMAFTLNPTASYWIEKRVSASAYFRFGKQYVEFSDTIYSNDNTIIPASGTHTVVLVYDGSQSANATRLKIYVDSVQKTIGAFSGTIPAVTANWATANLNLGANSSRFSDKMFDYKFSSSPWTPLQVADYHLKMMKQLTMV